MFAKCEQRQAVQAENLKNGAGFPIEDIDFSLVNGEGSLYIANVPTVLHSGFAARVSEVSGECPGALGVPGSD